MMNSELFGHSGGGMFPSGGSGPFGMGLQQVPQKTFPSGGIGPFGMGMKPPQQIGGNPMQQRAPWSAPPMQPSMPQMGFTQVQMNPGNSLFGHSQGMGMGQGNMRWQGQPSTQVGTLNPPQFGRQPIQRQRTPGMEYYSDPNKATTGQEAFDPNWMGWGQNGKQDMLLNGLSPEMIQQLLQMFGASQQYQPGRMFAR